jgi:hypothetical protein
MFNCYAIIFCGSPFAYFKTEAAAYNSVALFISQFHNDKESYKVEGKFIAGIEF